MRYIFTLIICFYSSLLIYAQYDPNEVISVVEKMPEFKGGQEKLREFLAANIKYPESARVNGISGTVYITFVVEGDGEISNVKALRGLGGGLTEEAIRVVSLMPKWEPGRQNGKRVRVQFTLPLKFTLRNPEPRDTLLNH
jgi:protein TonB